MSSVYRPRDISLVSEAQDDEIATSESLIDRHSHFNGLYHTSHDLLVEGSAEGEIECDGTLTVAPDAHLDAKVRARNVVIAGAATGEIMCEERFTLRPSGQMRGQVLATSLIVEEGAFFEGEFQMSEAAPSLSSQAHRTLSYPDAVSDTAAPPEDVVAGSVADSAEEDEDGLTEE